MRIVFYILLLANLGLLGYAWLSARHVNPDAELLNQQINPEKVRIIAPKPMVVSYVTNAFDPDHIGSEILFMRLTKINRPSTTVNFADGNLNLPTASFDVYDVWDLGQLQPNASTPVVPGSKVGRILSDERHRGNINMSYYDGHVEEKAYKKVERLDFVD